MLATAEQQVTALQQRFTDDIQATLRAAVGGSESGLSPLLRYHLGWEDRDGKPSTEGSGKAIRPLLCLTACELAGGDWRKALPAAAALEPTARIIVIRRSRVGRVFMPFLLRFKGWGRRSFVRANAGHGRRLAAGQSVEMYCYV